MHYDLSDKLGNILRRLKTICDDLEELVKQLRPEDNAYTAAKKEGRAKIGKVTPSAEELLRLGREGALSILGTLQQKELANLYISLGGASRDSKRSKSWLIERVVWQLFDFQAGHEIVRGNK